MANYVEAPNAIMRQRKIQYTSTVFENIDVGVTSANLLTVGLGDGQSVSRGLVLLFVQEAISREEIDHCLGGTLQKEKGSSFRSVNYLQE